MKNYTRIYIIIIILSSLATHFIFFGQPKETVFDEVHFGKFISGYFTHEYFFDIHPPLGKLLISGMGYLTGFKPGFSFADIGQQFPNNSYLRLRLFPILAGTLLPLIIFLIALRLGFSKFASFAVGIFVALENSLIVQSRFILLDSFLLLFGFSALLFYLIYRQDGKLKYLFLSGAFASLAISVKWTGVAFLGIILALFLIDWLKSQNKAKDFLNAVLSMAIIPLIIYFLIFAIHFSLLNKSGTGDAFMTPAFQKSLQNNIYKKNDQIKSIGIIPKFLELNQKMYQANATLMAGHPYSSKWLSWPFMIRPIYYWYEQGDLPNETAPTTASRIYFLGNPVIWWLSSIAMISILIGLLQGALKRNLSDKIGMFLGLSFLLNLLPFVGIKRAMFLYHYMPALIFAILGLVYLIDQYENKKKILVSLLVLSLASFIFFSPLTYGRQLSEKAYNARVWLNTWK